MMNRGLLLGGLSSLLLGGVLMSMTLLSSRGTGQIDLKFVQKPTIMTAAYKVYGNREAVGGKYWVSKLTLKNTGNGSLREVKVSFQIPDECSWSSPEAYAEILPGQTIVLPYYPNLPAKVAKITSTTPSTVEMKIEYDDGTGLKTRTERRDFQMRGVSEIEYSSLPSSEILTWYDANDNSELNSAWVTEEDPAVRAFYTKVSEVAGGFGTMGNAKDIEQLGRSTYNYMCSMGMTYSGTKGVPEKKGDDYVLVQSMRLPRDLLYGNSGLCVELAQLWASIALNAGAKCYLVMIPGHCFPVLQTSSFGDGTMLPIEATGIGGAGEGGNLGAAMTYEQAVEVATKNFQKVRSGEIPGIVIDVLDYRNQGIRPPELSDVDRVAFLKMLDDRVQKRQQTVANRPVNPPTQDNGGNGGGGEIQPQPAPVVAAGNGWQDPTGRLGLTYPAGWLSNQALVMQMQSAFPGYALSVANPQTQCGVDVIFFQGANNPNQVIQNIVGTLQNFGIGIQVGQAQNSKLGGRPSLMVPVLMQGPAGEVAGVMNVVQVPGGMVAVNVGGPKLNLQAGMPELTQVMGSIKLGN